MDNVEKVARAIMMARPNGDCIVKDWQAEMDNPHVATAYAQAQAALSAIDPEALAERDAECFRYKEAHALWQEKTEWVQQTGKAEELGFHRADILRNRIIALEAEIEKLREALLDALSHCYNCSGDPHYIEEDEVTGDHLWTDCPVCRSARAALGETK